MIFRGVRLEAKIRCFQEICTENHKTKRKIERISYINYFSGLST